MNWVQETCFRLYAALRKSYAKRMIKNQFSHVRYWVFDLDHTLYAPEVRLFDQIEVHMTRWVMQTAGVDAQQANALRKSYWQDYGTTLAGLMAHHDIDAHAYLEEVHDISFADLQPDPVLRAQISALPGRKIVYTNGSRPYAENVLGARGLSGIFDAIYGVEHANLRPKPERAAFDAIFALDGAELERGAMFEDDARNLAVPHDLGMKTVHVAPTPEPATHIHHHTADISDFLKQIVG